MSNNSYRQPTSIKKHYNANQNAHVREISTQKSSIFNTCLTEESEFVIGIDALMLPVSKMISKTNIEILHLAGGSL